MRIQHNITALNAHRNLSNNNSALGKNLEKLSSGYKINRAGDDAAGLAISEKMRAQITGLETAQKNANDGISLVQTAEGALTEVHSMLNRMVELATQSANGTYSTANRTEMQKEIKALQTEIDRIGKTANFNGTKLFNGGVAKVTLHVGESSSVDNQIGVTLKQMSSAQLIGTITKSDGTQVASKAVSTIDITNVKGARSAIDIANAAIDLVSSMRSDFGALQNRLEHTINNLNNIVENTQSAEAAIRDTDIATEMVQYSNNNILQQAGTSMLSQANQGNQLALSLLG